MSKQVVDTQRIAAAAQSIREADKNIDTALETLERAGRRLEDSWRSRAGEAAQTAMYQLIQNNAARSAVLQNYVRTLEQQVTPGYEDTETVNTKLADQFK